MNFVSKFDDIRKSLSTHDLSQSLDSNSEISSNLTVMNELSTDIRKCGFAGDTKIPELVYLSLLTGILKQPVSLLIKGPSGAGKSYALRMGKQFIPASAYEEFEGMSEKAILYLKGISLKHRHLIIGEASGMTDGTGRTLLRQLLSEGKVRYATVESSDKGLKGMELPTLEGPCGLIMTTTATAIHAEDESRMLSVSLAESPEQIRAALFAQADSSRASNKNSSKPDLDKWHARYEKVKELPNDVLVPFAQDIVNHLPTTHDRIKRDFPQVLSLISASALLHADYRKKDQERVVAEPLDYEIVYRLVNDAISEGMTKSVPDHVRRLVECVSTEARREMSGISVSKLAEKLNRDPSVISRTVNKVIEDGFVENTNPGQGREAKLVIGGRTLPSSSALPAPKVLFS